MDNLKTYEEIATLADALPDGYREHFALLLLDLAEPTSQRERIAGFNAVRRWAKDAGYLRTTPARVPAPPVPTVTWHRDPEHPGASGTYVDNRSRLWIARSTGERTWFIHRLTEGGKVGRVIGRADTLAAAKTLGRARILAELEGGAR